MRGASPASCRFIPKSIRFNAVVGFTNMLVRLWESEEPRAVFVGWDTLTVPTYRHEALAGIDLAIERGQVVALIGPNGSGKSTLLRVVAGLLVPDRGSVSIDGQAVTGPSPRVGLVFQEPRLLPWLDAWANVAFGLSDGVRGTADGDRRVRELLSAVGLPEAGSLLPHQLSGGMAQRVALARALARAPEVLLLDEPFGALDAQTRSAMQDLLLHVLESEGKTVLLITHSVDEAIYLSSRIVVVTARPARVRKIIEVPFGYPRTPHTQEEPRFVALRTEIRELVMEEYAAQARQRVPATD